MKLNIGSSSPKGEYLNKPWINIDANKGFIKERKSNNFIIGLGGSLPFRNDSFEEVRAIHVLEHLPRKDHLPFITEAARVLQKKGTLFIEVPNFFQICLNIAQFAQELVQTTDPQKVALFKELIRRMTLSVYGKGRQFYDFHHWGFGPWELIELGSKVGLTGAMSQDWISGHHTQEPVLLIKYTK